ncbi:MerR family transcriptional regulator [Mesorhizobium sp. B2-7-1]|uniref:MerR family transcriptional regulator n=1 Tax=Mesorhizobium sp. B2-7-1 TaxID=2589909 RepID=UPI001127ABBB|nr:MerR family transcriptional regulator [Mesorhizobium sp. B2-7-1]TPJ57449.1 MerR family transcriptional regulator [Mesorhizobium sp. B2-7-1]
MSGEKEQWFGPGETARRVGVTTKALRVYEREGLVIPHRAESRWRLYGPAQIGRLHQIIVLRDLGLPLKSIKKLVGDHSRLRDILRLQHETLESQQDKIRRAIALIDVALCQIDEGRDLSLDELAILTKETLVQQPTDKKKFLARFEALIAEQDPTGQASRTFDEIRKEYDGDAHKAALRALMEEASRLKEAGDVNSEAAKEFVRRVRSRTAGIRRSSPQAEQELIRDAYTKTLAEAQARSEALWFDPEVLEFFRQVAHGMRERGELD